MSKFQIIILGIFVIFIIVGVVAFATFKGNTSGSQSLSITVWGTFPSEVISKYVAKINSGLAQSITVKYQQEDPSRFQQDFVSALSRGIGPDAILIPSDMILPEENKLIAIPYETFPQRTFLDTYIKEADVYTTSTGIVAIPFTVDPLIMYWNRDMFDAAGAATYPRFWDEFTVKNGLVQKLTLKDQNGNIRKSAIALGDFNTVVNAREILGTLLLQSGNPVTIQASDGTVSSAIKAGSSASINSALQFFTQFVDPANANYSWNRGMTDSKSAFLSGILATYFGFASEISDLRAKNPNLNFDAAALPQVRTNGVKATYGRMYGFSLVRASPNANVAYQVINILTNPLYLPDLSQTLYLPSVRRDIINQGTTDPYIKIFNDAALVSQSWVDADPTQSSQIFGSMIESITSGRSTMQQAIQDTGNQYNVLLKQATQ